MLFEGSPLEKVINHINKTNNIMILEFLNVAANLKKVSRQGWIDKLSIENPESVADHTYSMSIMGMILSDLKNYNTEKILKMILLHDLAESITGDFTPEQKLKKDKADLENKTTDIILSHLPENLKDKYVQIWNELQKNESIEAKFVHQIDKLEMALQAKIYSKEFGSSKDITVFLDSAKESIEDPNLLKLFEEISSI